MNKRIRVNGTLYEAVSPVKGWKEVGEHRDSISESVTYSNDHYHIAFELTDYYDGEDDGASFVTMMVVKPKADTGLTVAEFRVDGKELLRRSLVRLILAMQEICEEFVEPLLGESLGYRELAHRLMKDRKDIYKMGTKLFKSVR